MSPVAQVSAGLRLVSGRPPTSPAARALTRARLVLGRPAMALSVTNLGSWSPGTTMSQAHVARVGPDPASVSARAVSRVVCVSHGLVSGPPKQCGLCVGCSRNLGRQT